MKRHVISTLLFTMLLSISAGIAAKDSSSLANYVGKWMMSDVPGSSAKEIVTTASALQLEVLLPAGMKLSGSRLVTLTRFDATGFSATDKSGVVIKFILKSPGHAEFSMKGYSPGKWSYFDTDLTRE